MIGHVDDARRLRSKVACLLGAIAFGLLGCAKVIGVPQDYEGAKQCKEYCDRAMSRCCPTNPLDDAAPVDSCVADPEGPFTFDDASRRHKLFETRGECEAYCGEVQGLPALKGKETPFECRLRRINSEEDAISDCNDASPTGGAACGDDTCESFCKLFASTCNDYCNTHTSECQAVTDQSACVTSCTGLTNRNFYDRSKLMKVGNYDDPSLQCRYLHLIAAISSGDGSHCGHANFKSNLHCNPP